MKPVLNQKGMNMDNLSNEDVVLDKLEEMMTWNGFARSLVDQHLAKGRLSPNQWAAAERMIAKMAANKVARDAKSIDVNVGKITFLFTLRLSGLSSGPRASSSALHLSPSRTGNPLLMLARSM